MTETNEPRRAWTEAITPALLAAICDSAEAHARGGLAAGMTAEQASRYGARLALAEMRAEILRTAHQAESRGERR